MTHDNTRAWHAINMRRLGFKLKDIAKLFDVTKERARQLIKLGLETERRALSDDPWDELSTRIRHALTYDGCVDRTPDGVVTHFKTYDWKRTVSLGAKSFAELNAWLVRHGREPLT